MECTNNCLSKQHGKYLTSAVTSEELDTLKSILKQRCSNPLRNSDQCGRTILHVSASIGRYDILSWLCDEWKTANILQTKDKESGWTALHRALYYGHIDCAMLIYKVIQDWHAVDAEGHSPLDLVLLDSPRTKKKLKKKGKLALVVLPFESGEAGELTLNCGDVVEILNTNKSGWAVGRLQGTRHKGLFPINFVEEIAEAAPVVQCQRFQPTNDIYMWGNNVNYCLGLGDSKNRVNPELAESLWSSKKSIKYCVVTKFHSVFLTECGNIFTCGHGLGGRLGHGNEETVLYPKMIEYFENINCTAVDASQSHAIVLDELGQVYTFGYNDFHQLGHIPPPPFSACPKQIFYKSLKNKIIVGIAAGRFHSVIYTQNEVYTFGLNAGQLGHSQGDKLITTPKLVTHLYKKDVLITTVVASDGATVCLLANGDLYLFQDYVCRKIALRMFDVSNLSVSGGMLQCTELESFNKPLSLRIAVLRNSGVVEVWRPGINSFKMCYWLGQKLSHSKVTHVSLGRHLILTTDTGQVYFGYFLNKTVTDDSLESSPQISLTPKKVEVQSGSFTISEVMEKYKRDRKECEEVNLVKVPLLYRCVKCFCDNKSRIFAAIQSDARIGLTKYPVIQSSKMSDDFKNLLSSASLDDDIHDAIVQLKSRKISIHRFILECRLNTDELEIYKSNDLDNEKTLYNFSCSYNDLHTWLEKVYMGESTTTVPLIKANDKENQKNHDDILFAKSMSSLALVDFESPLDDNIMSFSKKKSKKRSAYAVYQEKNNGAKIEAKETKGARVSKEIVTLKTFHGWKNYEQLSDVTIQSDDGCLFHCHKCILTSRAEYFRNMLNSRWIESSISKGGTLKIPLPGNVLHAVIDFLYTDEASCLRDNTDTTFIGEVLLCADQLLLTRLKDICELELADKVSLKNAIEIFQFACDYSAEQLKTFLCEFLSLNLPYFLEARLLEYLSEESLQFLSNQYRKTVVGMESRKIEQSQQHRITDELEKTLQEAITNDLNKIKSRRGRLSSSRTKSVSSMSDSDFEQSVSVHQLPNDVFEKTSPGYTNEPTQRRENTNRIRKGSENHTMPETKSPKNADGHVNGLLTTEMNGCKSLQKDEKNKQQVWNMNNHCAQSTPCLNENGSSNVIVSPKNVISPFKKKSQKERKKERVSVEEKTDKMKENVEMKKPVCPWANSAQQTHQVSFREVLSEEKPPLIEKPRQPTKARSTSLTQGIKREKGNPWCSPRSVSECEKTAASSFVNIINIQEEEKEQLSEQAKKPLHIIQLEEKAIQELFQHYKMVGAQGEYVTVKRIKPVTAVPYWEVDINKK